MVVVRKRGEKIRQFILSKVDNHPKDIVALTCREFDISRQAVNKHIKRLIEQNAISVTGTTRSRQYTLQELVKWGHTYRIDGTISESNIWNTEISKYLDGLPENIVDIWQYGFTEILNNAIDHSTGTEVYIQVIKTATTIEIMIYDNGEGIFKKIQRVLGLHDERHSVLELAKGKLTTDPDNHSGEGIFFSSRMFDKFDICSGKVFFSHNNDYEEDWITEHEEFQSGTCVFMKLANNSNKLMKQIFDSFSTDDNYGFTKTIVPVRLTQYGDDKLVSRSQAKRLMVRIEKFKTVVFDFDNVEIIGQAFADEIFRVFQKQHLDMELIYLNANNDVEKMIKRALTSENLIG